MVNFGVVENISKQVIINVWVDKIRNLGSLIFLDAWIVSQNTKCIQLVIKNKDIIKDIRTINLGDLLEVKGIEKLKNNGLFEVEITKFLLINKSRIPPFLIKEEKHITEETKYNYRFLDLRRTDSKNFLILKSRFLFETRLFFNLNNFLEVETPILSQFSPEGSECFKVFSRFKNCFYTLAQSPQIFKQLLMVGGIEKYYQIAKCFRNEDARSNRQIEFLQLDVEQSFVFKQQIFDLIEKYLLSVIKKVFGEKFEVTFTFLTYDECLRVYKTDKPDLRKDKTNINNLSFVWITDWPLFGWDQITKKYIGLRHPFTKIRDDQKESFLRSKINPDKVIGDAFDLVCNGEEILSGGLRINERDTQEAVFLKLGYSHEEIDKYFGYFLKALGFAAPPHGGFGLGIDRLLSAILSIKNLKEFIAFPKSIDGRCFVTGTPTVF